jgi:tripartite-type tricarboxylate transporter receptor subunit TctC
MASGLQAQQFPNGPVRWILPEPTGGNFDNLARGIAPALSKQLKVPVIVQNVPGPEGVNQVFRAKPDGQTIGMLDPMGELAREIVVKPDFNVHEMTWLGRINAGTNLVVASKKSGIRSFNELKGRQAPVRIGIFGLTSPFVQFIMLSSAAEFPIVPVNYRTIGELIFGHVRGDTDLSSLGVNAWIKHIEADNAVPILLVGPDHDARSPGTPSLKDVGLDDYSVFTIHRAVSAPPRVPTDVRAKLVEAFRAAMSDPGTIAFLERAKFENNSLWGADFDPIVATLQKALPQHADILKQALTK